MSIIENDFLRVNINPFGAELNSLFSKEYDQEYMWSGNPSFWGKYSPVLFPFVGTLKNDQYFFKGKEYQSGRHGFAREKTFLEKNVHPDAIDFLLSSDEESFKKYPFHFEFRVKYVLHENTLTVGYEITNTSREKMYFSVGGHPAFAVPLEKTLLYEDYYLQFDREETKERWPISKEGLIEKNPIALLDHTDRLPLTKELFQKDALVFKSVQSKSIVLKSDKGKRGLKFDFPGFPYLGIWAAKGADFVCIEPWCGIADSVDSNQQLMDKEGINVLNPSETFFRSWNVTVF